MPNELAVIVVLTIAQLAVLRASQYLVPSLYFTTSSLFDERSDVRARAVAARHLIPLSAGVAAAFIAPDAGRTAVIAATTAWLLAVWPAIWSPSMLPHAYRFPIFLLIGVFFLSWAGFAWLGAEIALAGRTAWDSGDLDLTNVIAGTVMGIVSGGLIGGASRLAQRRVKFVDDYEPYEDEGEGEFWDLDDGKQDRRLLHSLLGVIAVSSVVIAARLVLRRR